MTPSSHVRIPLNLAVNSLAGKEPISNYEDFMGSSDSLIGHIESLKKTLKHNDLLIGGMRQVLSENICDVNHIEGKKGLLKLLDTLLAYLVEERLSISVQMQQEYSSPNNYTSLHHRMSYDVLEPRFKAVSEMIADVYRCREELESGLNMMRCENVTMLRRRSGTGGIGTSPYTRTRELELVGSYDSLATGDSSNTLQQTQDHSVKNETENILINIPADVVNDPRFTTGLKMVNDPSFATGLKMVNDPSFVTGLKMLNEVVETVLSGDMDMAKIMIGGNGAAVIGLLTVYFQGNTTMRDFHPNMAMEFVIGSFATAFAFSFIGLVLRRSYPRIANVSAPLGTGLTVFGFFSMIACMFPPKFMWFPGLLGFLSLGSLVLDVFKMK